MTSTAYHEKLITRAVPWGLLQIVCILAFTVPLIQSYPVLKVLTMSIFGIATFGLARSLIVSSTAIIVDDNAVILRGVRPGRWKLFQNWFTDRITDAEILSIRVGYIREKRFGFVNLPPAGEPSKNARFQMFLWIKYTKDGNERELYYPHLKNIQKYKEAIDCLRARFGSKYQEWL